MSNTAEKERVSAESVDDVSGSESGNESPPPPPRRERRMQRSRRRGGGKNNTLPIDQLPVSGVQDTATNAVGGVSNALGGIANNAVNQQQGGGDSGGKSDTLRLRLDLNLDVEIHLKAKIHGDLELALLN